MKSTDEYLDDLRKRLVEVQQIFPENLGKAQEQMETQYNQGKRLKKISVGDLVLFVDAHVKKQIFSPPGSGQEPSPT